MLDQQTNQIMLEGHKAYGSATWLDVEEHLYLIILMLYNK
jgi:hypothetical protein